MYTVAPALPSIRAIPFPIPLEAPVTIHTLPLRLGSSDKAAILDYCSVMLKVMFSLNSPISEEEN